MATSLFSFGPDSRMAVLRPILVVSTMALLAVAVPPRVSAATEIEVRVERVKPQAEKHPTLRFLRENLDFLRAALDRTRQRQVEMDGSATAIDPRFLAYSDLIARVSVDRDSVSLAESEREKRDLLRSITQLGDLEAQLDQYDRLLAAQRERLAVLQHDFTGDQRTALAIVLSGYPKDVPLGQVAVTLEDGYELSVPISADQRDALRHGGAVQIFHGYVEPREQIVQIALAGDRAATGDPGYLTLDPERDRLTLLRLDLTAVQAADGAPGIHATTWLNDARAH